MKVLMLGWELPPHNSGGLGIACYQLCESLSRKDIDLDFILPYSAGHDIPFMRVLSAQSDGVVEISSYMNAYDSYKYVYSDGRVEWRDIYSQVRYFEQAASELAASMVFDIVHAHDWLTFKAALRIKALQNSPIILHVHSVESDRAGGGYGNPLVHDIEEMALMAADSIIAVSQHTKDAIIRDYHIQADKIDVVHNSIDASSFEPMDENNIYRYLNQLKSNGYKIVVNVGRLTIQKGLINFLHAAKEVLQHFPKTMFMIVGSGEQYIELVGAAADLGIGANVLFTGFQRGKNQRDAYAIADLFVLPSISEPFGLTPLEAGMYGVPSVVSKQAGVSEVLINCLRVDHWDIHEMANQITGVITSPVLGPEMGRQVRNELSGKSWETSADKIKDIYKRHMQTVKS